ncbi:hypothetical protein SK128_015488 [Halocaridina rubra]|uniref:Pentraxin (PTX) domain-containing protein n=1 Tax=Halocaridina rubra TaxID=373956 RepID=A0AAN8XN85_HALRR
MLMLMDATLINVDSSSSMISEVAVSLNRDLAKFNGRFRAVFSYSGKLSQVNMWSRVLQPEEIWRIFNCSVDVEGDMIAWSADWELNEVEESYVPLPHLCGSVSRGRVTVRLPFLRYDDSVRVCRGLRGFIDVPTNHSILEAENEVFKGDTVCERRWGGANDNAVENMWYSPFTGESYPNVSSLA